MNENEEPPVTETELARVATPRTNAAAFHINADGPAYYHSEGGYVGRDLAETLERELAAARAAIKVARSFLLRSTHRDGCPKFGIFPKECTCGYDEAFNALNTHTHE